MVKFLVLDYHILKYIIDNYINGILLKGTGFPIEVTVIKLPTDNKFNRKIIH